MLHVLVTDVRAATSSRRKPSTYRRISRQEDTSPLTSELLGVPHERLRSRSANTSAKSDAVANSSLWARIASIRVCSLSLRSSGRRTHSNDDRLGDGGGGSDGCASLARSRVLPATPKPSRDVPLYAAVRAAESSRRQLPVQVGRVRIAIGSSGVDPFTMRLPSAALCPSRLPLQQRYIVEMAGQHQGRHHAGQAPADDHDVTATKAS
jgi:hypothetical protein